MPATLDIGRISRLNEAFEAEAKARRKTPHRLLAEVVEDLSAARAAEKALKASAGKPRVTLQQLKTECGL